MTVQIKILADFLHYQMLNVVIYSEQKFLKFEIILHTKYFPHAPMLNIFFNKLLNEVETHCDRYGKILYLL